jgi:DNA polymerase-3 subunit epsilon
VSLIKRKLACRLQRLRQARRELPGPARANLSATDHLAGSQPARAYSYAVVDLETTGLDTATDRVVSVGAVRLARGRVLLGDSFVELVNPGRGIPAEAVKIHGIKPDQVAGARDAAAVFRDFLAWLGSDILVAHYAEFDLHFINLTMRRLYGFPLQNLVLDVVRMCRGVVLPSDPYGIGRNRASCSLESLAQRFGLSEAERHTAAGDALVTALIFQRLLARLEEKGPGRLADLERVAGLD